MNYLTLENVTKIYGEKTLFEGLDLHIAKSDKIALVAKNGTGKSTLLRVVSGLDSSDGPHGKVWVNKDIRVGFLDQEPDFDLNHTVLDAIFDSENPLMKAVRHYEECLVFESLADQMPDALMQMEELKAWDYEARIKEILSKLKITYLEKRISQLSGGQRKRIALAKLIIEEPEFIVLDEPTNHLDLDMIEWLEKYLQTPSLTVFMVTHDRYFLERVCNNIVELDGGKLHKYKGNYSEFLEKKAIREEIESNTLDKSKKLLSRELEWIRRQPQARGTKAKSRVDAFYQLKDDTHRDKDRTSLSMEIKGRHLGSKIVELHNISKAYEGQTLINKFDYKFKRKERVGIVGPNGAGKSTLLRLITEEIMPDAGKVVVGETIEFGYYDQSGMQLKTDKRVLEVITDIAEFIPLEKGQKITASAMLERFLFSKSQQQVYVSQLSGGERRRLYLLTVLMKNPNFLILDEPTNDLDVLTLQVLEDFLMDFPGCLVVVTHDRYFMDKMVDHLFIFEGDGNIKDYNGQYSDYRADKLEEEAEERKAKAEKDKKQSTTTVVADNPNKKLLSSTERREFSQLERDIENLEKKKTTITEKFNDPKLGADEMMKLSTELGNIQNSIETKEMRWMELADMQ